MKDAAAVVFNHKKETQSRPNLSYQYEISVLPQYDPAFSQYHYCFCPKTTEKTHKRVIALTYYLIKTNIASVVYSETTP